MSEPNILVKATDRELEARFAGYQRLTVRQRKRWLEILLSFEMKNAYDVYDEAQMPVFRVREEGSGLLSFLKRIFLGPLRFFTASVVDLGTQQTVMTLLRPFRFFFHRLEVSGPGGQGWGAIERRWSWLRRLYIIEDENGAVVASIFGPLLRPWTFEVRELGPGGQGDGQDGSKGPVRAVIRKRWSGFLKEAFSDADNFGVELADLSNARLRALVFAATVLIDVVHFERAKGG
jgi:uncharacterized protein YxjI